jgi:NAD(P)-dependent dehydrogenase (short-subunit alcohol dehydrogenase family)
VNEVVLITGASTGFGRVSAELLAQAGYRVIATMRDVGGRNAGACAQVSAFAEVVELDVTSDPSVEQGIAKALKHAGHIDVVINNAGFANIGVTEAYTADEFRELFETNFFGVLRVNRAVLPDMRRRGIGLLIHVSSVAGRTTLPYMAPYCSSKYALESVSEAYRMELAPFGIDCVVVEPGAFSTPVFDKTFPPGDTGRTAQYGRENYEDNIRQSFAAMLSHPKSPPISLVAETFRRLIETPLGQRPFRTFVGGGPNFLESYNAAAEEIRAGSAELFGVTNLLVPRKLTGEGE